VRIFVDLGRPVFRGLDEVPPMRSGGP
jgi:hypothetical protein